MDKIEYIVNIVARLPLLIGFGGLALYSLYDITTTTILRTLKKRDEQLEEQRKKGPNREQKRKALKEEMRLAKEREERINRARIRKEKQLDS